MERCLELASRGLLVISISALDSKLAGLSLKIRECARRLVSLENNAKKKYDLLLKYLDQLEEKWVSRLTNKMEKGCGRLCDDINYRIEMEKRAIEDRMKGIKEELAKLDKEVGVIHKKLRREAEKMKKANPRLNEKEERLKAKRRRLSRKRGDLLVRKARLSRGIIRRIINRRLIRRLDWEIKELDKEIEDVDLKIYKVRMKWQDLKKRWEQEKKEAEKALAEVFVRMAELKQELIFYRDNLDRLALEGGIKRFIWDLTDGNADPDAYDDPLISECYLEFNKAAEEKRKLEEVIKDLAFSKKILIGFDRGIKRFRKPLGALRDEESRFSQLPKLKIKYPKVLDSMSAALDRLLIAIEEAERDPELTARAIKPLFEGKAPFSSDQLKSFFDEIGDKVRLAVDKQWGR